MSLKITGKLWKMLIMYRRLKDSNWDMTSSERDRTTPSLTGLSPFSIHPSIHVRDNIKCLSVWQLCIQIRRVFSWYFGLWLADLIIATSICMLQHNILLLWHQWPGWPCLGRSRIQAVESGKSFLSVFLKDPPEEPSLLAKEDSWLLWWCLVTGGGSLSPNQYPGTLGSFAVYAALDFATWRVIQSRFSWTTSWQ